MQELLFAAEEISRSLDFNFFSQSLRQCYSNSSMRWKETLPGNTKTTSDRDPGVMWMPERWALDTSPLCGIHSPKRGASERPPEKASCWEELLKAAAAKEKGVPPAIALSSSLLSASGSFLFPCGVSCLEHSSKVTYPSPLSSPLRWNRTGAILFSERGI